MKYNIRQTSRYKKSLKLMLKRGKDIKKITKVVRMLAQGETLPPQYKDHPLIGDYAGSRDCHIENDWVLIYKIKDDLLILSLAGTDKPTVQPSSAAAYLYHWLPVRRIRDL